nr:MAG TPA: hypothetical protein [Caudoviricetes sp.]
MLNSFNFPSFIYFRKGKTLKFYPLTKSRETL